MLSSPGWQQRGWKARLTSHQRIPLETVALSLREEDVGFVEKQDAFPQVGVPEDVPESLIDHAGSETQVSAGDGEQRLVVLNGDRLRCGRLPDSRRAVEQDGETLALATDDVQVEGRFIQLMLSLLILLFQSLGFSTTDILPGCGKGGEAGFRRHGITTTSNVFETEVDLTGF